MTVSRSLRHVSSLLAIAGLCSGVCLFGPTVASARPVVSAASPVEIDGGFEVRSYSVTMPPVSAVSTDDVGALRAASTVTVELEGAPEMVVIDTFDRAGSFEVRSRNDGVWTDWIAAETAFDEAPDGVAGEEGADGLDGAVPVVGPIWIGDGAEALEVVVTSGAIESLEVETLTSLDTDTTEPTGSAVTGNAVLAGDEVIGAAVAAVPSIQPRSAWADAGWVSTNEGCSGGPFYADSVRAVIVHHTVSTNDYAAAQVDDLIRGIYRFHTQGNGWCDIAYNFIIDRFGTIWEARSGGFDRPVIGGHARGFNTATTGISLLGQHQAGASPAAAGVSAATAASLQSLAAWKLGQYGVDPLGTTWLKNRSSGAGMRFAEGQWVELPNVMGHRDVGQTSCPGSLAYPLVGAMRSNLGTAGQQIGAAPYQFPAWTGAERGVQVMAVDNVGGVRPGLAAPTPGTAPALGGDVVAIAGTGSRGYVLTGAGDLRAYGGAPAVSGRPAGGARTVDVSVASGAGGWVVTADGTVAAFGGARAVSPASRPAAGTAIAAALDGAGNGYVLDAAGGLHPVGSAPAPAPAPPASSAVDIALRPDGRSGWVLDAAMNVHAFGGAPAASVIAGNRGAPRAIVASPTGYGGYVLDAEGRILSFGLVRHAGPVSSTVGQPIAVDLANVGFRTADDLGTPETDRFVRALYTTFIGAAPNSIMLEHWIWRTEELGSAGVAGELARSDEWAGAVVDDIYTTALGRAPDEQGRRYWIDQLRRGLRVQDLGTYFYGSNEYFARAGSPGAFVDRLYRELLHRDADAGGRAYWVGEINARRATPSAVATGFYASLESRRDRVATLFQRVLGREPDPGGHEYWAGWLAVEDDIDLAAALASSPEYYARATR